MTDKGVFTYYQPEYYYDDGTNIGWSVPDGLFSFQAFRTEDECVAWLENNGHDPDDCVIHEYTGDDIEDVVLIDEDGEVIDN